MPGQSTATTRLRPYGATGRTYGSFTKSPEAGSRAGQGPFTRITPAGVTGRRNGSFAGRAATTQNDEYSTPSIIPVVTIGDVTDVDIETTHSLIPRVTLSTVAGLAKSVTMSLVPKATMARGQVTSSSNNKASAPSLIPVVTLAVSHLNKTWEASHSLIPVVTLSNSVDTGADTLEATSDHSLIPVVTLSSSVDDLVQPKSASHSLIPVATLSIQVNRYTATVPWDIPVVVAPRVTLTSTARIAGDVDRIDISTSPFGYIEITRV
jgi:hypothetical protein